MPDGIDYSAAEAYKDYVEEIKQDLFTRLFFGFKTSLLATPHEGVKGKLVLTEMQVKDNLARRYADAFAGTSNVAFVPSVLEVVTNKVEHQIVPHSYEGNYLGAMRQKGQNPTDNPFEGFILDKIIKKLAEEMEVAVWQGVAAGVPASTDFLRETFDGYLKLVANAIIATTLTPVATGAITEANAVDKIRLLWEQVSTPQKDSGTDIFCSYTVYDNYRKNYKERFNVNPLEILISGTDYMGFQYELGGSKSMIIPVPGMGTSGRVIIAPREYFHYGYDDEQDWNNFNFQQIIRELKFWMDFNMGVQILMLRDGHIVVNDQA